MIIEDDDLYIIGAVCLYVCMSVTKKLNPMYSKDFVVSPVYRHFSKVNSSWNVEDDDLYMPKLERNSFAFCTLLFYSGETAFL